VKTASVTGASNGIGKAIVDLLKLNQYSVLEFDIERDISVPENRKRIVEQSKDCDVFINNAWASASSSESQLDMFQDFVTAWHDDKNKHIINMGSLMRYKAVDETLQFTGPLYSNEYRITKKELHKHTILKHLDLSILCKISIAQPGLTETDFTTEFADDFPMMKPSQVARQILDIIESPVHIIETSFRLR